MDMHSPLQPRGESKHQLRLAFFITVGIMWLEFVSGWITGSLSLIADAGHMLTDAAALAFSFFAAWIAEKPATPEKTYGYYRTEILAALANGIILWLIVIWIFVRALTRFQHPLEVQTGPMIMVALVGLIANLVIGMMLMNQKSGNLNIEGAWLNVMSDAMGSIGVIIAGLLIRYLGWVRADAVASMVIGILIAVNSWNLIKRSVNILLEGTPSHLNMNEVIRAIKAVPGVCDVHDVHLWTITVGLDAMSGHVIVENLDKNTAVLEALRELLVNRFGIQHTTFQLERMQHACSSESPSS